MELNKFQRILWTINGVLFLIVLLFAGFQILKELLKDTSYKEPEVIVGKELEKAKKDGLILQGLDYDDPFKVYGSHGYILPVSIKTFNVPKENKFIPNFDRDSRSSLKVGKASYNSNTINIVFLDQDLKIIGKLLSRKAFIKTFKYPFFSENINHSSYPYLIDTVMHHLTYLIGFEDTNKDGVLNYEDQSDLYLSDLLGQNLIKVTDNIDIQDYFFINSNEILIKYFPKKEKQKEYRRVNFSKYWIKEKNLQELIQFNESLDAIEKEMIQ